MRGSTIFWSLFATLAIVISACEKTPLPANNEPALVSTLLQIEGRFEWREDLHRYVFSDPMKLEAAVAAATPSAAVPVLINCLDNQTPARATLNGKAVMAGIVCYQALSQTASHEENAPGDSGDIAQTWTGHLEATANLEQLIAAKQAWLKVLKNKTYGLL